VTEPKLVTLTVDGKRISVPEGMLIIRAAEALGIQIPRFCDHPLLDPVGACRQCLVQIEGQQKLATSCTTPVADGMVIFTQETSDEARKGQEGQLEFLLINHPLDCPVCDRGGECPLQDQALAFGTGKSRYIDPKRVYEKPLRLSPLVLLDRERCVLCARCTRFCDQISGERFIELFDRGPAEQVSIAPGEDFRSPFSGNTVQICPVGALTSAPYRFAARPFDTKSGDSQCAHCASGCSLRVDVRRGEVVRHLARDNMDVNEAWLCDKGRYAYRFNDRNRLTTPLLATPGLVPTSFQEVFRAIADRGRNGRVAFVGGGRLTDEDSYAMAKLARAVFGTNDLDHRLIGARDVPIEVERYAAAGMPVTYQDVERAKLILVVGLDSREELPILHLRIRKAQRKGGARVVVVHPRRTALADIAEHLLCLPGEEAGLLSRLAEPGDGEDPADRVGRELRDVGGDGLVLAGPRLAESGGGLAAAAVLARQTGARFAYLSRRAGDRGALRAGVHPGLLPGGRRVGEQAERAEVEAVWGSVPAEPGKETHAIFEAAARREIDVLFLVGVDPLVDFPDPVLARRAIENAGFKVVVDIALDAYRQFADAMLPAAPPMEKAGRFTDWEGRSQAFRPVRAPQGLARPEWEMFQELSEVAGRDMGLRSLDVLRQELDLLAQPRQREIDVSAPPSSPEVEGEGLLLFTYPLLVDEGRLSVDSEELKAALGEEPYIELHPDDAAALGLEEGAVANVKSEAGEAALPVRVSGGIAKGAAFVPWHQAGFQANTLLSGRSITRAAVEGTPAEEPVEAKEGAA
jgi:NADH-quinone oxidoreductase subunit G